VARALQLVRDRFARRSPALVTFVLLLPGLLAFFGLFFYPFVVTFLMSLRPEGQATGWTLGHYLALLSDPQYRQVVFLTFGLAIASTAFCILLSVPLSLVLRRKLKGNRFFRMMVLVPLVVPGLIAALGLLLLYGSRGWFNLFLRDVVPGSPGPLNIVYTVPGLILFYVWLYFPYTCLTTLSALEGVDPGIEEAAEVAGANRWKVLRHIVLPLITPGILSGSVLTFMAAFGAFSIPLIAGGNYRPLAVEIYKQIDLFIPARWSMASAMAVLMGVMQVVFLTIYMRFLRRGQVKT
jgi:putative spermidine/putrescine transport system permease protein